MPFRYGPTNRITRIAAALILAAFGAGLIAMLPPVGLALVAGSIGAAIWQGVLLWQERRSPYDLSRLREMRNEEPEDDADRNERDMIYCHRCGSSMSARHSICPQCGCVL